MIPGIQSGTDFRAYVKGVVGFLGQSVLKTPLLKQIALAFLTRMPALRMRLRRIIHDHQANPGDIAAYGETDARRLAASFDVDPAVRSARSQSDAVNGLQKTPLESYFY